MSTQAERHDRSVIAYLLHRAWIGRVTDGAREALDAAGHDLARALKGERVDD